MKSKSKWHFSLPLAGVLFLFSPAVAQKGKTVSPDLTKLAEGKGGQVYNRSATVLREGGKSGIRLDAREGDGVAYLDGVRFTEGVIEFDVRGKDVMQQSFVGVDFQGVDEKTYEAIYFRPFNFNPADQARKARAVQYISHPEYPWNKLREEQPGKYEQPVSPVPDPDDWFHVRVAVEEGQVSVFVNDSQQPCLRVQQLSSRRGDKVGLWVGNQSAGDFANLKVIAK